MNLLLHTKKCIKKYYHLKVIERYVGKLHKKLKMWNDHVCGIIAHAINDKQMDAELKIIPVAIITRDLCLALWNSFKYDISTANGPQTLFRNSFYFNI